jgi:excisionase family DNA binding protein
MMEKLLSVKEAAERLGISPHTIRSWQFQRKLDFVQLGRRIGFRPEDLDSFIKRNLVQAKERT